MKKTISSFFSLSPFSLTIYSIVLVLFLFFVGVPLFDLIELKTYDLRFRSRGCKDPSPAIAIAVIDERSLDVEGRWPWPRARIAALVDVLSKNGAKVIGLDVGFFEPDENSQIKLIDRLAKEMETLDISGKGLAAFIKKNKDKADNDLALANAIRNSSATIVLGYFFHMDPKRRMEQVEIDRQLQRIMPSKYPLIIYEDEDIGDSPFIEAYAPESNLDILSRAAPFQGHFNMLSDQDGVLRWVPVIIKCGGDIFPSMSLLCAWDYLDRPRLIVKVGVHGVEGVRMGERFIPTDESGQILINYLGPSDSFPYFSISDILAGEFAKGSFEGKVVLVGATATGLSDIRTGPTDTFLPGVEVHATVIDNILKQDFLSRPRWSGIYDLLAIIILGLLTGIALPRLKALTGVLFVSLLFVMQVMIAHLLFVESGTWLNLVYPILVLSITYISHTVYGYFTEEQARKKIKGAFSRYVSPSVVNEILKHPEQLKLGGEERVVSVLFCDLAGFTTVSERLAPHELVALLSDYFTEMTEQIFAHGGMLNEYVGDELMAIFGAPLEQEDHAEKACAAAMALKERQHVLREAWAKIGRPPLWARTGVNSGPMLVGNMGSVYRFSYGVMGDHVNLASRLEGLNKIYGTEVLIGENTARMVNGAFLLREVDRVRVKGREQALSIYEPMARAGTQGAEKKERAVMEYAAGLDAYREQRWKEALTCFAGVLALSESDQPSLVMAERCRAFRKSPPMKDWDGVFQQTTK